MISKNRKPFFIITTFILSLFITLFFIELLARLFSPHPIIHPRWEYSPEYGLVLPKNTKMVHTLPNNRKYIYSINSYGYRGKVYPISNKYINQNIIVLGDSYAFGAGVNDGEEFSAILQDNLRNSFDIINLSIGGFGLAQQIRRFYEFGQLYRPTLVILQFCGNDPDDNLVNRVTEIRGDRFVFRDTDLKFKWYTKYLSNYLLQYSQGYLLIRHTLFNKIVRLFSGKKIDKAGAEDISLKERYYNELLEHFVYDLREKGISIIIIAANSDLKRFPQIFNMVAKLESNKLVKYFDVEVWFPNEKEYLSPEGHWGKKAHFIIGQKLAYIVNEINLKQTSFRR